MADTGDYIDMQPYRPKLGPIIVPEETLTIYVCGAGHRDFKAHGSKCTDGLCDRIAVPREYVRKLAR